MMDGNEFVACIGKPEDAPEVEAMLAAVGVKKKLKMPKDDIEARVDLPEQGLSLIFEPEGRKSSRLVFNGVQFFSGTGRHYKRFAGALPADLQFSTTQSEARGKLGKPFKTLPKLRRDIWKLKDLQLAITYTDEAPHVVAELTVEVPLKG
jgi:hypothetical protein